jgi:hypothetical protein
MAAVHQTILGMKPVTAKIWLALGAAALFLTVMSDRAQQIPNGHATDFTSNTYFEPPNDQKVKMKFTGTEAAPLPGGLLDVKQLRIETFSVDGKLEMIVQAPQCNYAVMGGVANSPGHIEMQTGDGKFHIEGDGFLWRQNESLLIISNNVHTVIKGGTLKFSAP